MKQTIHSHSSDSAANNIDTANNTNADRYRMLFESFGSVKIQNVIRSRETNKATIDSVVGADTAVANSNVKNDAAGRDELIEDRYHTLFESFGSVKKQKVIRSREANKVTMIV
eukprot:CAMPEP_0194393586 /NCGR_PEP_ID=MMETSP0174-20130528/123378_1 /TAXON_ID=216777 /ORGANISM="Proboscia alata, Strain PI-D3" /LENGTH=112 /DNA_ID=CAMNT_0039189285 /DNA_START=211 /DNA_END=549 /DNA_ORIENTATION=+